MKSSLNNARISPKKMNLIAGIVRGEKVVDALNQLKFTPKKAAKMLYKALKSAVDNAKNNFDQKEENLYVKEIIVNKGVTLKRGLPIARGQWHPILKRNCNVTIEIGLLNPVPKKEKTAAKSTKSSEATEAQEAAPKPKTTRKPAKKNPKALEA